MLLGCRTQQGVPDFAYAAITLSGRPFTGSFRYPFVFYPCRRICHSLQYGPTTPNRQRRQAWHRSGLGSSRFARRYSGNRCCFLFLRVLRWFTSPGWLPRTYVFSTWVTSGHDAGFPHSGIDGSRDVCSSPSLIAAYHALLRLHAPRHPPCALCSLPNCLPISKLHSIYCLTSHDIRPLSCLDQKNFYSTVKDPRRLLHRQKIKTSTFENPWRRENPLFRSQAPIIYEY